MLCSIFFFFFNDPAPTEFYTLSLHDALPICGWAARMATEPVFDGPFTSGSSYVKRFSRTERTLHWVHASAFLVLLGSGLVLYVPRLSELVGRRPLVKDIHFDTGLAWMLAIALVVLLGDRGGLRQTLRELDAFD